MASCPRCSAEMAAPSGPCPSCAWVEAEGAPPLPSWGGAAEPGEGTLRSWSSVAAPPSSVPSLPAGRPRRSSAPGLPGLPAWRALKSSAPPPPRAEPVIVAPALPTSAREAFASIAPPPPAELDGEAPLALDDALPDEPEARADGGGDEPLEVLPTAVASPAVEVAPVAALETEPLAGSGGEPGFLELRPELARAAWEREIPAAPAAFELVDDPGPGFGPRRKSSVPPRRSFTPLPGSFAPSAIGSATGPAPESAPIPLVRGSTDAGPRPSGPALARTSFPPEAFAGARASLPPELAAVPVVRGSAAPEPPPESPPPRSSLPPRGSTPAPRRSSMPPPAGAQRVTLSPRPSETPDFERCPGCQVALPIPNPVACDNCGKRLHRMRPPAVITRFASCPRCGHKNKAEVELCTNCGEQVMKIERG